MDLPLLSGEELFVRMNDDLVKRLRDRFGDQLKENEPMSKHTNFRIGGPARLYLEVKTKDEMLQALEIAGENRIVIHGGGSNTLYADQGVDALVLVPALREISIEDNLVAAGAGVLSGLLARKTAEAGLSGLEWMISLPGTVGGAVRGNAGCFGGETKDNLKLARVLKIENRKWKMVEMTSEDLKMSYRHSLIKENQELIVFEVVFELVAGDVETLKAKLDENLAKRKTSQPTNVGSAGCIFKNYEVSDSELETLKEKLDIPEAMQASHRIAAGWIVDQLDLKGKQIGGAKISDVHGNFLVNDASASANEIMQLISFVKTRARNELGIHLQEEIQYVQ